MPELMCDACRKRRDQGEVLPRLDLGCLPDLSRLLGGQYHSGQRLRAPEVVACITAAL